MVMVALSDDLAASMLDTMNKFKEPIIKLDYYVWSFRVFQFDQVKNRPSGTSIAVLKLIKWEKSI